jgi:hypothetical protein
MQRFSSRHRLSRLRACGAVRRALRSATKSGIKRHRSSFRVGGCSVRRERACGPDMRTGLWFPTRLTESATRSTEEKSAWCCSQSGHPGRARRSSPNAGCDARFCLGEEHPRPSLISWLFGRTPELKMERDHSTAAPPVAGSYVTESTPPLQVSDSLTLSASCSEPSNSRFPAPRTTGKINSRSSSSNPCSSR